MFILLTMGVHTRHAQRYKKLCLLSIRNEGGDIYCGQRRWDTRSNKKETDGIHGGYEIQRKTVSMNILLLVWIRYSASQRLIQTQCGLRDSTNETFLCAARDLFGVVVRR